jgi:hypothetical protein
MRCSNIASGLSFLIGDLQAELKYTDLERSYYLKFSAIILTQNFQRDFSEMTLLNNGMDIENTYAKLKLSQWSNFQ